VSRFTDDELAKFAETLLHGTVAEAEEIGRLLEPDANSRDAPPEPPMPDPQSKPWKGFMPGWVVRFWRTNKRSNG
jgi:hypothetical protein